MNGNGTTYQNGRFVNVDKVHNNTKNMTLSGFNQEGGKVTGNIQNLTIRNIKKVDYETGKEVVISANGQIVKDYINQGTSNYYTYGFDEPKLDEGKFDKKLHGLSDVVNYISEGTGVQDETTTLERIDMSILGWLVSANYDGLKKWAVMNNYNTIGYKEYFKYRIYKFNIDSYKNPRRNMYK